MQRHKAIATAIAAALLTGCLGLPDESSVSQLYCTIADQQAGTCPTLAETTDATADDWMASNYPGTSYSKTGVSCTYGPAVTSCRVHIHITPTLAVTVACAQQNNGQGFNCTAGLES